MLRSSHHGQVQSDLLAPAGGLTSLTRDDQDIGPAGGPHGSSASRFNGVNDQKHISYPIPRKRCVHITGIQSGSPSSSPRSHIKSVLIGIIRGPVLMCSLGKSGGVKSEIAANHCITCRLTPHLSSTLPRLLHSVLHRDPFAVFGNISFSFLFSNVISKSWSL